MYAYTMRYIGSLARRPSFDRALSLYFWLKALIAVVVAARAAVDVTAFSSYNSDEVFIHLYNTILSG